VQNYKFLCIYIGKSAVNETKITETVITVKPSSRETSAGHISPKMREKTLFFELLLRYCNNN